MDDGELATRVSLRSRWMRHNTVLPIFVLIVFALSQVAWQIARSRADALSSAERIYATLVKWGADASGLIPPVDQGEIDRHVEQLWSEQGEVRVRAAHWLAARGLRETGDQIAASMTDPGTRRPCQLAHSLGKLGDDQWVDELLVAANQPYNTDLRACALIGLTDIASTRAVDALIELTRDDPSSTFAIAALGEAGDFRTLDHLRWLHDRATNEGHRHSIELAIERVELLSRPDPVPELINRVESSAIGGRVDEWALRHLARQGDHRSVEPLVDVFADPACTHRTRELLAASLLAHGDVGHDALAAVARHEILDVREVARIALSLRNTEGPGQRFATSDRER